MPGHTPDSVCYWSASDGICFVGDTIFKGAPGTSRFPGGDPFELRRSIAERVLRLPGDTVLLSGHSAQTTVDAEKQRQR